jgi:hypothetical protein
VDLSANLNHRSNDSRARSSTSYCGGTTTVRSRRLSDKPCPNDNPYDGACARGVTKPRCSPAWNGNFSAPVGHLDWTFDCWMRLFPRCQSAVREVRAGYMKNPAQSCAESGLSSGEQHTPTCPNCARLMLPTRVIRSFQTLPELRVYHCDNCDETLTWTIGAPDYARRLAA